ncbi:MAG: FixH family protein [Sulfobacillus sp.]
MRIGRGFTQFLLALAAILLTGCGASGSAFHLPPQTISGSSIKATVSWTPSPLVALKPCQVTVTLKNSHDVAIVQGAAVAVKFTMQDMSMPPVHARLTPAGTPGAYKGQLIPVMAGPWLIDVTINYHGHRVTKSWSVLADN